VDSFGLKAARIATALDAHRQAGLLRTVELEAAGVPEKAVGRTDKNAFQFIGTALAWDTDFLSDGTPFTVVAMQLNRPFGQTVYLSCLGSLAGPCAGTGRRQFDGYMFAGDGDAFDEFLFLAVATKVKK